MARERAGAVAHPDRPDWALRLISRWSDLSMPSLDEGRYLMKPTRKWPLLVAVAAVLTLTQTGAFAKGPAPGPGPKPDPAPGPTSGPTPSPTPGSGTCRPDGDPFPPSPMPVPYADSSARVVVVGYMGASMAAEGYHTLGGRGMSVASPTGSVAILPNAGLGDFASGAYWTCSPADGGVRKTDLWPAFIEPQLGAERAVWWLAALTDDEWRGTGSGDPVAVRGRMEAVLAQIRQRTSAPVYVSAVPDLSSAPVCKSIQPAFSAAVRTAIDAMVASGEVLRGPVLPPLTAAQKLNRCHPNAAGEAVWGSALLNAFGA